MAESQVWYYVLVFLLLPLGVCIPCYRVLRAWLIDGELETLPAIGLIMALLLVTGLMWQTQNAYVMLFGICSFVGGTFAVPLYMQTLEKEAHRHLHDVDIEKYLKVLEFDPNNAGARAMLAEEYLKLGRRDEAMLEYQKAIELSPQNPGIGKWRRKLQDLV